jgi:hypothetical protein
MSHNAPCGASVSRNWEGPLIGTESPPAVPGMQRVGGPARDPIPNTWPPAINAQEAQ